MADGRALIARVADPHSLYHRDSRHGPAGEEQWTTRIC